MNKPFVKKALIEEQTRGTVHHWVLKEMPAAARRAARKAVRQLEPGLLATLKKSIDDAISKCHIDISNQVNKSVDTVALKLDELESRIGRHAVDVEELERRALSMAGPTKMRDQLRALSDSVATLEAEIKASRLETTLERLRRSEDPQVQDFLRKHGYLGKVNGAAP